MKISETPFDAISAVQVEDYAEKVGRHLAGELTAADLKSARVLLGIYEQRHDGEYMTRVRLTGGVLSYGQAEKVAELSRSLGNGVLHITTRQDIQLHNIALQDTPELLRELAQIGLTTRGGGGDSVRNVTVCTYAGICPAESIDVLASAKAVTNHLVPNPASIGLPRKFKIAFSGCRADCAYAQITDLGFVATNRQGKPGFRVFAGGGMGAYSRTGSLLLDWVPADEAVQIAEATRRVFNKHGDRENRKKARLRFVVEKMGEEGFTKLFRAELSQVIKDGVPRVPESTGTALNSASQEAATPRYQNHRGVWVLPQRQNGWATIPIYLESGLISSEDLAHLAKLASRFSPQQMLHATREQGLQIRFIKGEDLDSVIAGLRRISPDFIHPIRHQTRLLSCTGASTCRLGICRSRDAALACKEKLVEVPIPGEPGRFTVHVNGCQNACGHHPVAPIGLSGCSQTVDGRQVPSYRVFMGGCCNSTGARLGTSIGRIPARALPDFLCAIAEDFMRAAAVTETFSEYFERKERLHFVEILIRHASIPGPDDNPEFYRDYGSGTDFSVR